MWAHSAKAKAAPFQCFSSVQSCANSQGDSRAPCKTSPMSSRSSRDRYRPIPSKPQVVPICQWSTWKRSRYCFTLGWRSKARSAGNRTHVLRVTTFRHRTSSAVNRSKRCEWARMRSHTQRSAAPGPPDRNHGLNSRHHSRMDPNCGTRSSNAARYSRRSSAASHASGYCFLKNRKMSGCEASRISRFRPLENRSSFTSASGTPSMRNSSTVGSINSSSSTERNALRTAFQWALTHASSATVKPTENTSS